MGKLARIIGCILLVGLVILSSLQYMANNSLKARLGGLYRSNIMNYKLHVIQLAESLKNENELNENDLRNLYYKANMLMTLEMPDKSILSLYETQILHHISLLEGLVSEDSNSEKAEAAGNIAKELLISLEEGLTEMLNTGLVLRKDGTMKENLKAYYELSLAGNKTMERINENLKKTLELYLQISNP